MILDTTESIKLSIDINREQLEKELKQYANDKIKEDCLDYLNIRLKNQSYTINDRIGKAVSSYLSEANLYTIIDTIFKDTDLEQIIKESINRQIGKKVKKLLEEI